MKLIPMFTILCLCSFLFSAGQSSQPEIKEDRKVAGFHTIRVATGISAVVSKVDAESITISAATVVYKDRVITKVKDSVLFIYYEEPRGANLLKFKKQPARNLKAIISYKTLRKITAETGAVVNHSSILHADDFTLVANTGSIIKMLLASKSLHAKLEGGSIITLKGNTDVLKLKAEGGSQFFGSTFLATDSDIISVTGATVTTSTSKKLNAKAHTGGIIRYKGDVPELIKDTGEGGLISQMK